MYWTQHSVFLLHLLIANVKTLLFKIYQYPIVCLQCSLYIHLSIHGYFSTFHTWAVGNDASLSVDLEIENSIARNGVGETKEMTAVKSTLCNHGN